MRTVGQLWVVVLSAFLPASLCHFAYVAGRVVVTLDLIRAGYPGWVIGSVVGLFAVVSTIGSLAMGRFIDRVGAARAIRWGAAVTFSGTLLAVIQERAPGNRVAQLHSSSRSAYPAG